MKNIAILGSLMSFAIAHVFILQLHAGKDRQIVCYRQDRTKSRKAKDFALNRCFAQNEKYKDACFSSFYERKEIEYTRREIELEEEANRATKNFLQLMYDKYDCDGVIAHLSNYLKQNSYQDLKTRLDYEVWSSVLYRLGNTQDSQGIPAYIAFFADSQWQKVDDSDYCGFYADWTPMDFIDKNSRALSPHEKADFFNKKWGKDQQSLFQIVSRYASTQQSYKLLQSMIRLGAFGQEYAGKKGRFREFLKSLCAGGIDNLKDYQEVQHKGQLKQQQKKQKKENYRVMFIQQQCKELEREDAKKLLGSRFLKACEQADKWEGSFGRFEKKYNKKLQY